MFKNNIYIAFLALLILTVSCQGFLDKNPLNSVSENIFWNDENDVKIAVAGVYSRLQENFMGYERVYLDALTDNAFADPGNSNQSNLSRMTIGGISPGLGGVLSNLYSTPYKIISSANFFLDNVDRVELDEEVLNGYKAEIRFLRALAYFDLVQNYGGVVIYKNFFSKVEDARIPKSSEQEVYDFIHEDLDFAIDHLNNAPYKGKAVKASALGIKARAYMVQEKWESARPLLEEIINSGLFGLSDNFEQLFTTEGQKKSNVVREILFATQYLAPNNVHRLKPGAGGLDIELGWFAMMQPYENLVRAFQMSDGLSEEESPLYDQDNPFENRDPRLYLTVKMPEEVWVNPQTGYVWSEFYNSYTGFHVRKYVDLTRLPLTSSTASQTDQNYIHLRYADVLLMYAEVLNEIGGPALEVYDAINQVRARPGVEMPAIDASVVSSQSELREVIREERRVELALEGVRYHDLKRWNVAHIVLPKIKNPSGVQYVFKEHHYRLPFTISELENNPALEQNPGYN